MNTLLRKVRRGTLAENRFKRYLIYAVGEIVLVVIGILIALNINNWNEGRKLAKVETALLKQLLEDAVADSAHFASRKSLFNGQIKTMVNFRALCEGRLDTIEAERILPVIESPFLLILSHSDVMNNSPDAINEISDPGLKNGLRQYKLMYEYVALGTELVNNSLQANTTDPVIELSYTFPDQDSISVADLHIWCDDEDVIGYSTLLVRLESVILIRVENMIEENRSFIAALRKTLGDRE